MSRAGALREESVTGCIGIRGIKSEQACIQQAGRHLLSFPFIGVRSSDPTRFRNGLDRFFQARMYMYFSILVIGFFAIHFLKNWEKVLIADLFGGLQGHLKNLLVIILKMFKLIKTGGF